MPEITEIFVIFMEYLITTNSNSSSLYAEIYTFPDHGTAKRVITQFALCDSAKTFLAEENKILCE